MKRGNKVRTAILSVSDLYLELCRKILGDGRTKSELLLLDVKIKKQKY